MGVVDILAWAALIVIGLFLFALIDRALGGQERRDAARRNQARVRRSPWDR